MIKISLHINNHITIMEMKFLNKSKETINKSYTILQKGGGRNTVLRS